MALTTSLISYYKFDENSGTTVGDSVGTNTGTYNGSGTAWTTGIINSGGNFVQANSNSVHIPGFNNIITYSAISVQAWVKFASFPSDSRIVANSHTDSDSKGIQLYTANSGGIQRLRFDVGLGSPIRGESTGGGISTGTMYHVIGVYDGATVTIYINNVQGSSNSGSGTITASALDLWISGNPAYSGDYVNGVIDEVAIWNRALTSTEVSQLYNSGAGLQYPFTSATGRPKVWNGSAWVQKPLKVWSGSAWVEKPVKVYNGSSFVEVT